MIWRGSDLETGGGRMISTRLDDAKSFEKEKKG